MSKNYLSKNDELRRGDYLISNNGNWKAVFQDDGNFVIYGWHPVWASDTHGSDAFRLCMQADSNLVMYNSCNTPRWSTNTYIQDADLRCHLQLTDEEKLVVCREAEEVWNSKDSRGRKL